MKLKSIYPNICFRNLSAQGSTLVIALLTLAILSFAIAAIAVSVSTTANVSLQAASWQEAEMAAEAGADTAMACFQAALNESSSWSSTPSVPNALTDTGCAWGPYTTNCAIPAPSPGTGGAERIRPIQCRLHHQALLHPRFDPYADTFRPASGPTTGLQAAVSIEAPPTWRTTDTANITRR